MGTVYKAVQKALGKTVAIKMLKTQDSSDLMWARFKQEAKTASLLSHTNIVHVNDFGATSDGQPYMVMDFVEGTDLGALIKNEGKLKPFEAIKIFMQVCDAMEHAHNRGVLHRDLKPTNVMLTNLTGIPEVKIVDFGIAKFMKGAGDSQGLTQTGEIFGSPYYMSPEQTVAKEVDRRSDIYAVGCIMYETLSGVVPICGNTAFETMLKHTSERPISLQDRCLKENFSLELQKLVMKSLEKEPAKRFQTMAELKEALAALPEARGKAGGLFGLGTGSYGLGSGKSKIIFATACGALLLSAGVFALSKIFTPVSHNITAETQDLSLLKQTAETGKNDTDFSSGLAAKVTPAAQGRPEPQLQVVWTGLDDVMLAAKIDGNSKVTNLVLKDCDVTDDGVKLLRKLNLMGFSAVQCGRITDKGFLDIIQSQPYLEVLRLIHTSSEGSSVLPTAIGHLRYLKSLTLMDVHGITGEALHSLPHSLEMLSLTSNNRIATRHYADLAGLTNLTGLDLSTSCVSNTAISKLTKLTKLKALVLNCCPIGDEAIDSILRFQKLEVLSLRKTFITPEGFLKLTELPHLHTLDVTDTGVKDKAAEEFEAKLTNNRFCVIEPYIRKMEGTSAGTLTP